MKKYPYLQQIVVALWVVWQSGWAAEPTRLELSREAMGGTFSVIVYGEDRSRLEGAAALALEEAVRLDQLLSNYKPSSEWSQVNREAGKAPVTVSSELFQLLTACFAYSQASEGTFDITVGPLMRVWGFYKGSGKLPHRAEIRTAMGRIGYRNIVLDSQTRAVRFDNPGLEIDPGGIGKGYAVDRMAQLLREQHIQSGFISAAGSTLYGLGTPPNDARGWLVNIRDPRSEVKTIETIYLKDESLSTSGSQEKFFEAGGKVYSHIMDPRSGYPAQGVLQVSVTAPSALDSEAWTKPIFIQGRKWAAQHKPKGLRAYICEDKRENSCAWLQ